MPEKQTIRVKLTAWLSGPGAFPSPVSNLYYDSNRTPDEWVPPVFNRVESVEEFDLVADTRILIPAEAAEEAEFPEDILFMQAIQRVIIYSDGPATVRFFREDALLAEVVAESEGMLDQAMEAFPQWFPFELPDRVTAETPSTGDVEVVVMLAGSLAELPEGELPLRAGLLEYSVFDGTDYTPVTRAQQQNEPVLLPGSPLLEGTGRFLHSNAHWYGMAVSSGGLTGNFVTISASQLASDFPWDWSNAENHYWDLESQVPDWIYRYGVEGSPWDAGDFREDRHPLWPPLNAPVGSPHYPDNPWPKSPWGLEQGSTVSFWVRPTGEGWLYRVRMTRDPWGLGQHEAFNPDGWNSGTLQSDEQLFAVWNDFRLGYEDGVWKARYFTAEPPEDSQGVYQGPEWHPDEMLRPMDDEIELPDFPLNEWTHVALVFSAKFPPPTVDLTVTVKNSDDGDALLPAALVFIHRENDDTPIATGVTDTDGTAVIAVPRGFSGEVRVRFGLTPPLISEESDLPEVFMSPPVPFDVGDDPESVEVPIEAGVDPLAGALLIRLLDQHGNPIQKRVDLTLESSDPADENTSPVIFLVDEGIIAVKPPFEAETFTLHALLEILEFDSPEAPFTIMEDGELVLKTPGVDEGVPPSESSEVLESHEEEITVTGSEAEIIFADYESEELVSLEEEEPDPVQGFGTEVRVYVNGQPFFAPKRVRFWDMRSFGATPNWKTVRIAGNSDHDTDFAMFAMFARSLNESEVLQLYNDGAALPFFNMGPGDPLEGWADFPFDTPRVGESSPLAAGYTNETYELVFTTRPSAPPYTWEVVSGTLPPGLALSEGGELAGEPDTPGEYTFEIRVTDDNGETDVKEFSLEVFLPLSLSNPILPSITEPETDYSLNLYDLIENGAPPYSGTSSAPPTFASISNNLPDGMSYSMSGTNWLITGTPTENGVFTLPFHFRDSNNRSLVVDLTLEVSVPATIITETLPSFELDEPYSAQLEVMYTTGAVSWTVISGSLPDGVALSASGLLSGTPTEAGSFSFEVQATDGESNTATREYAVEVVVGTTSPMDIAGLKIWLDGTDESTMFTAVSGGNQVTDGDKVARWEDKSGNEHHATNTSSSRRPTYKPFGAAEDAIYFGGWSRNNMGIPSAVGVLRDVEGATIIIAVRMVVDWLGNHAVDFANSGSTASNFTSRAHAGFSTWGTGGLWIGGERTDVPADYVEFEFNDPRPDKFVGTYLYDYANGELVGRLNTESEFNGSLDSAGNTPDTDSAFVQIGGPPNASTGNEWDYYVTMYALEILVWDRKLDATEREQVQNYLMTRHNIT